MPAAQDVPVAAVTIKIAGTALDNKLMMDLLDVQVRDNLLQPDTALLRFRDPDGAHIDDARFTPGKDLEVMFAARDAKSTVSVFKGEIVGLEPEFSHDRLVISIRAYDHGWRLNRNRRSQIFTDITAADMIKKIGGEAGMSPGTIEPSPNVYKFFQQSMETDWEFCQRLARLTNCEFVVDGKTFHFRPRKKEGVAATLEWGEDLLSFRPRLTAVGQVKSVKVASPDPKTRQVIVGEASAPQLPHTAPAVAGRTTMLNDVGAGSVVVANHVAETGSEANSLAQNTLDRLAMSLVEADGAIYGDPAVTAGCTIKIDKVGTRFAGEYVVSQTTHRYGGGRDYKTEFVISGRTSHSIADLVRRDNGPDWASSLVIGIVTNNNDPENLGRVRVKFPQLGDTIEGWWARVATPHAGKSAGMYYLPDVDDEVVVAFEHGDTRRPIILGSLYNGRDKVPTELIDPGAAPKKPLFGVKTSHEAYVESTQKMTLRSHEKMTVEVLRDGQGGTGDFTLDAKGNVKETAAQKFEVEGATVSIKGQGSVTVEATGGLTLKGATVDIQATGPVNVKGAVINLG
jgi:phage protein D/phage baseplate assembly protein gpV